MYEFHGQCHCGNLDVVFRTRFSAGEAALRACQCSFCRKHGVRAVSDPGGAIEVVAHDPALLNRYRFGTGITEFLICRRCGVYIGAYTADGERGYANVIVNVLDDQASFTGTPQPTVYDGEDEAGKRARRREKWTPATLRLGAG